MNATTTIAISGTLSGVLEVKPNTGFAIMVPTIDTAICYLQGSLDGVTYARVQKGDGSADLSLASGTGGKLWIIDMRLAVPYLKIETSAAQTAVRTFRVSGSTL
ncbi:MAG: hypothetical protein QME51_10550 [Planctomycetota bacterium]|nr:hypothetical protein [Planctomycetota bacterium]